MRTQFDFWGYTGPTDGTWTVDGEVKHAGEDFRTVERFKEYKDAGLNIYFPQTAASYKGEEWNTSNTKLVMDRAYEAGLDRIILHDPRIQKLSAIKGGLIGEGKLAGSDMDKFHNDAALDAHVAECMSSYIKHPAFYGVMLVDEPRYDMFLSVGQIYRSIKRVCPDAFIQCCLGPPVPSCDTAYVPEFVPEGTPGNTFDHWRAYLERFIEVTGADYIMYDQYPFVDVYGIYPSYILGLQTAADVCRRLGVRLFNVTQTCSIKQKTALVKRIMEADAYWLTNMLMGFSVDTIAYFTYWTKQTNKTTGETFFDDASFVNRDGTKTDIYYFMQKIHAQMQKFAPVILSFSYNSSSVFIKDNFTYYTTAVATNAKRGQLQKIVNVEIDKESALITELIRNGDNQYMYMVQNIVDPRHTGKASFETIKIEFLREYTRAEIYEKGECRTIDLDKGSTIVSLYPGQAVYIMPLKITNKRHNNN